MSLLQKSIRRGHEGWAQRAASTLLRDDPTKLWRRLICTAFEDIGVADLQVLNAVPGLLGKRSRALNGGDWQSAAKLIHQMVAAPKCRAADDLLMSAQLHPCFRHQRQTFIALNERELSAIVTGSVTLQERAIALWLLAGTDSWSAKGFPVRQGSPTALHRALLDSAVHPTLLTTAEFVFRRTRSMLPLFVALLEPSKSSVTVRSLKTVWGGYVYPETIWPLIRQCAQP